MSDSKPLSKTIPQTMNEMQMKAQESKETESIRKRMTNLTDQRFGRLVAEYPTKRRDHKGSVYWHCHCDCGQNTEVTEDSLVSGNKQSCGCLKKENQRQIYQRLHHVDGTCVEWLEKRKKRKDNTSGFRGVYLMSNGRYRVMIGFRGERFYLGTFDHMDEAVRVRQKAERDIHDAFVKKYRLWSEKAASDHIWGRKNPFVFRVIKDPYIRYRVISSPDLPETPS